MSGSKSRALATLGVGVVAVVVALGVIGSFLNDNSDDGAARPPSSVAAGSGTSRPAAGASSSSSTAFGMSASSAPVSMVPTAASAPTSGASESGASESGVSEPDASEPGASSSTGAPVPVDVRTTAAAGSSSSQGFATSTSAPATDSGIHAEADRAAVMLAGLPVQGRAPKTGYSRAQFGQAWTDDVTVAGGHNGCDTRIIRTSDWRRESMMARDLQRRLAEFHSRD